MIGRPKAWLDRHRPRPDSHSPGRHPGHQPLCQSGSLARCRLVRGGAALAQVWMFIVAPLIGGAIAGVSYAAITGANTTQPRKASRRIRRPRPPGVRRGSPPPLNRRIGPT